MLALGGIDGTQHWKDAVWLPVRRLDCKINPVPTKKISLQTNKEELFVLGWRRIVLFDTDIGRNALDKGGSKHMEMLGIHSQGRNKHHRPNIKRPLIQIANQSGDLDLYVVHYNHAKFHQSKNVEIIFEAISKRMHATLPQVSERMMKELQKARVHERVYSAGAVNFLSRDLLVNNVGVLESYQSPPHIDKNDIGWTYAFACKCGPCSATH